MARQNSVTRRRILGAAASVVAAAVMLTGCSGSDSVLDSADRASDTELVVGAGVGTAGEVLGEIYAGALRRAGAQVEVRGGFTGRGDHLAALDAGLVDLVPEFSGALLNHLQPGATVTSPDEVFEELSRSLPQGISVSDFAGAEDRAVLALPRDALGDELSLADFAPRCAGSALVRSRGWDAAATPAGALEDVGCRFAVVAEAESGVVPPAASVPVGLVPVVGLTTADPDASADDLAVLADPDRVFTAQNVLPVFRSAAISDRHRDALAFVAGELTTTDLAEMVGQVRTGQSDSADVARDWLDAHV